MRYHERQALKDVVDTLTVTVLAVAFLMAIAWVFAVAFSIGVL